MATLLKERSLTHTGYDRTDDGRLAEVLSGELAGDREVMRCERCWGYGTDQLFRRLRRMLLVEGKERG